jgi:chromatin segregation and condensation protein Rec8/ScpA/Scc1 (kleisin family)
MNDIYPSMLYHIVELPVIVHSEQEEIEWTAKGWQRERKEFDEYTLLKAKISHYEELLQDLYAKRELVHEKFDIEKQEEETPVKRKPGRPKGS